MNRVYGLISGASIVPAVAWTIFHDKKAWTVSFPLEAIMSDTLVKNSGNSVMILSNV
jgi:hypothetical protein